MHAVEPNSFGVFTILFLSRGIVAVCYFLLLKVCFLLSFCTPPFECMCLMWTLFVGELYIRFCRNAKANDDDKIQQQRQNHAKMLLKGTHKIAQECSENQTYRVQANEYVRKRREKKKKKKKRNGDRQFKCSITNLKCTLNSFPLNINIICVYTQRSMCVHVSFSFLLCDRVYFVRFEWKD